MRFPQAGRPYLESPEELDELPDELDAEPEVEPDAGALSLLPPLSLFVPLEDELSPAAAEPPLWTAPALPAALLPA